MLSTSLFLNYQNYSVEQYGLGGVYITQQEGILSRDSQICPSWIFKLFSLNLFFFLFNYKPHKFEPGGMCIFFSCWLERINAIFLSFVLAVDFRPLNKPFFSFFVFVRIQISNFYFLDSQKFVMCEERYV